MSDSLTRLAQRIDFCRKDDISDGSGSGSGGSAFNEDSNGNDQAAECTFRTMPVWPWEQVRNKMTYVYV